AIDPRDAAEAIAPLTEALDPKVGGNHFSPALALAEIGPPAMSAIPALRVLCQDRAPLVSACAAEAIARIDPEHAGPAVEHLARRVVTGKAGEARRVHATASLHRIGPPAKAAVPVLCELLKDPKTEETDAALAAVMIDPVSAKPALDWIRAKLRNGPKDEH